MLYKWSENLRVHRLINYKGFCIEYNLYDEDEYSVQYCGDDAIFWTEEEAREFIDEIQKGM